MDFNNAMLISNGWTQAADGQTLSVVDPATGEEIARVPAAGKADVDRAVAAARQAFDHGPWPRLPAMARAAVLNRLADLIEKNADMLADLETRDSGKPRTMARNVDLNGTVGTFRYMAALATQANGESLPLVSRPDAAANFHAYTAREPIGVIGQIIPWNFPLLFCSWKIAPALAFGNTVVLKPAEQTPLTALALAKLAQEAGVPPGVLNVVTGFGETAGAAIVSHPDIDKIAFTGSTDTGKLIVSSAVATMKRISLELGGKSPVVILEDADVEAAIAGAAHAIFFNQGEACVAGSRIYAHRKIYERVVEGVARAASVLRVGPGMEPSTQIGPMVSAAHRDRVAGFIREGISEGARVVAGGPEAPRAEGYFVAPTVLADVRPDMSVVREEIFGPVVVTTPFDAVDEVVAAANDSIYGLAAGIWTKDVGSAHRLARRLQAGTVWINCHHVFDPNLPFGGFKQSGWGREQGSGARDLYTEAKTVCIKL